MHQNLRTRLACLLPEVGQLARGVLAPVGLLDVDGPFLGGNAFYREDAKDGIIFLILVAWLSCYETLEAPSSLCSPRAARG